MDKSSELETFRAMSNGQALDFIEHFRARSMKIEARTNYGITIDTSSTTKLMITFVPAFYITCFAPFPWQVSNTLDYICSI